MIRKLMLSLPKKWHKKYQKYAIVFASTQLMVTRLHKYPIDPKAYLGRWNHFVHRRLAEHLCQFGRGHYGEHSCEIIFKFGPVVQEKKFMHAGQRRITVAHLRQANASLVIAL